MKKCLEKFVVSHPTGNTFVRALLLELNNLNHLEMFLTTMGTGVDASPWVKSICRGKRQYAIPDKMISRQWMPELSRLLSRGDQEKKRHLADQSYQALDKKVSNKLGSLTSKILHAYEDGCSFSFVKAKVIRINSGPN